MLPVIVLVIVLAYVFLRIAWLVQSGASVFGCMLPVSYAGD